MKNWLRDMLFVVFFLECRGQHTVRQSSSSSLAYTGETATLNCEYNTTDTLPALLWYRQTKNLSPEYILVRHNFGNGSNSKDFPNKRFQSQLDSAARRISLTIQNLHLSDSSMYFCALRPTVKTGY
uniref:T-cell receptor alpha/delta variable 18.0 n=1 Tax=Cyprinus carpio TaxID=7962 RepID=A0A8C1JTG0_CYPCA